MAILVPFRTLGHADHGWLDAHHHFSFADYIDESRMHFGPLRVWNDDRIAPHTGFGMHAHRDMEIVTYVRRGAITHRDHLGNLGRTAAGDVQVMSAGHGVTHAEHNEEGEPCELFQIWVAPRRRGSEPRWEQRAFPKDRYGEFVVLASGAAGHEDALFIDADATLFGLRLRGGERTIMPLRPGRIAYGVAVEGRGAVNKLPFAARDGFAVEFEDHVEIRAEEALELCLLELPGPSTAWGRSAAR